MDADLQHPPRLLARMLELLEEGADQVVARRTRTGDSWARTRLARGFYRAINAMTEVRVDDGAGDYRLLGPAAVRAILSMEERNRFSKGLFAWIGLRTSVVDYDNVARQRRRQPLAAPVAGPLRPRRPAVLQLQAAAASRSTSGCS